MSDALIEEVAEEAVDWLERGGLRRVWAVIKITALIVVLIIGVAVLYII
ncbi:MAG: hypothetical protein M5U35_09385 [Roseovarius sp.]|nr:hypothetical protein [Roseovarius sp.]